MLTVEEHSSPKYSPRTYVNANGAELTVAFAVDFSTAGEKLTHKAAGERYLAIKLGGDPIPAARQLYAALRRHGAHTLNVAGNGIYTLMVNGTTQRQINLWVYDVLAKVAEHWPLKHVRSGGQTGVDIAGVVAAHVLDIDALALLPKGFIQRHEDGVDRTHTEGEIRQQILNFALALSNDLGERSAPSKSEPAVPGERNEVEAQAFAAAVRAVVEYTGLGMRECRDAVEKCDGNPLWACGYLRYAGSLVSLKGRDHIQWARGLGQGYAECYLMLDEAGRVKYIDAPSQKTSAGPRL